MIYFICGHRGCGKSYLVDQLKEFVDCRVYDTGPILRSKYKEFSLNSDMSFGEWIEINEQKYGKNFTNHIICENMDLNLDETNIIIGNRSMIGIQYAIEYFDIDNYKVCFIDGNFDLFRLNYNKREKLNLDKNEFEEIIALENSMGIEDIEYFVKNNPSNGLYFYKENNDNLIFQTILEDINTKSKLKKAKKGVNYK